MKYYKVVTEQKEIDQNTNGDGSFKPGVIAAIVQGKITLFVPIQKRDIFFLAQSTPDVIAKTWDIEDVDVALNLFEDSIPLPIEAFTPEMKKDVWQLVLENKSSLTVNTDAEWQIFRDAILSIVSDYESGEY